MINEQVTMSTNGPVTNTNGFDRKPADRGKYMNDCAAAVVVVVAVVV